MDRTEVDDKCDCKFVELTIPFDAFGGGEPIRRIERCLKKNALEFKAESFGLVIAYREQDDNQFLCGVAFRSPLDFRNPDKGETIALGRLNKTPWLTGGSDPVTAVMHDFSDLCTSPSYHINRIKNEKFIRLPRWLIHACVFYYNSLNNPNSLQSVVSI